MGLNLDMTLREFFELAARVGDAARVIREAQAMLGGASPVTIAPSHAAAEIEVGRQWSRNIANPPGVLLTNKGPVTLTPDEQAQRERLRIEREAADLAAMPDNIKALMQAKS